MNKGIYIQKFLQERNYKGEYDDFSYKKGNKNMAEMQKIKKDHDTMREENEKMNKNIEKELSGVNEKLEHVKIDARVMKETVENIESRLDALEKESEKTKMEENSKRKREVMNKGNAENVNKSQDYASVTVRRKNEAEKR